MLNVHPQFVHYPIALLITAFGLEILWLLFRKPSLYDAATVTLTLGTLGVVAAATTGLMAEATLPSHSEAAHEIMEAHETFALVAAGLAAILVVWRLWRLRRPAVRLPNLLQAIGLLILTGFITYTAHLGGRMVYEYGVGGTAVKMPAEAGHDQHAHSD